MQASRPDGHPSDSGPDIRTRLRRALTAALTARDSDAVSALRSALSAIGNAEAVDPGEPGSGRPAATGSDHVAGAVPFAIPGTGPGAAEAERRHLTEADVTAIVGAEAAEREAAASQYEHARHAGRAAGLRHGTQALLAALDAGGADGGVRATEPDFLRETRASYDAIAVDYAERFAEVEAAKPWDRAVLDAFAEYVRAAGDRPVADVGCGPGRVTAYLSGRGLTAFGIDLSPGMIEVARASHPGLRFEVGSMLALDLPDDSVGGVLAWYSTIHVPDELLPRALAEFRRVLVPGGHLLLAFQAGDEPLHRTEAMGHAISLVFRRRQPERVAELLGQAGLPVRASVLRAPDDDGGFTEVTAQAFVLARKP
jgi:SAM-dependent methyltransferase